jgi:hypothetical protein
MRYSQGYRHIEENRRRVRPLPEEKLEPTGKASPAQEIQELRDLLDPRGGILLFP